MSYWEGPTRWVNTLLLVIVGFIGFDTLFRMLEANQSNVIVGFVTDVATYFLAPFVGMFNEQDSMLTALVAVLGYSLAAGILLALFRALQASRPSTVRRSRYADDDGYDRYRDEPRRPTNDLGERYEPYDEDQTQRVAPAKGRARRGRRADADESTQVLGSGRRRNGHQTDTSGGAYAAGSQATGRSASRDDVTLPVGTSDAADRDSGIHTADRDVDERRAPTGGHDRDDERTDHR